jgi:aspartate racemase
MLGLVGGSGLEAGIYYYRRLHQLASGCNRSLPMILIHADVEKILQFAADGDGGSLAEYLSGLIKRLEHAGATIAAIAAVTPHMCIDALRQRASVPIVDLLEVVRREARPGKRALIVGTRTVMESRLFNSLAGMSFVELSQEELAEVDSLYKTIVRVPEQRELAQVSLVERVRAVHRREQPDVIVIAGTDLSPSFSKGDVADLPIVDVCELHIQSIHQRLVA